MALAIAPLHFPTADQRSMTTFSPCPCGSQRPFLSCCGPYLSGQQTAPTAEALMRSRYTAYTRQNIDYLIATHHPSQRVLGDRATLKQSMQKTTWLGLTILNRHRNYSGLIKPEYFQGRLKGPLS